MAICITCLSRHAQCSMCNVSDAFACMHSHESGDWGVLADVTRLLQNPSGFSGPQAHPHPQASSLLRHHQEPPWFKDMVDGYLREFKRLDNLVAENPYVRSGWYVPPPTFAPQQAEGARWAPHQEDEASLSEADHAHSTAQLLKVHLLSSQRCCPLPYVIPGVCTAQKSAVRQPRVCVGWCRWPRPLKTVASSDALTPCTHNSPRYNFPLKTSSWCTTAEESWLTGRETSCRRCIT